MLFIISSSKCSLLFTLHLLSFTSTATSYEMANPPKEWDDTHNNCAYLNETHKLVKDVKEMLLFLKRSRIFYAISEDRTPYLSHQRSFWKNAQVFEDRDPQVIVSNVLDKDITISEQIIRECLHFGDGAEDPTSLPDLLVRGCLLRIKYDDDVTVTVLNKSNLSHPYKYLAHVIIHCLGPRKGGYDELSKKQLSAMVALILNRPFNFSTMIFTYLKEMVRGERLFFLMYPRFLQIIFDRLLENLPNDPSDQMKLKHQNEQTVARGKGYRSRTKGKPPSKRMIGHIAKVDYMPPANDRWRHDDSDSDVEDITMESTESQAQGEADASATRAEVLTTSAPEVQPETRSEPQIVEPDLSDIRLSSDLFSRDDVIFEFNTTGQTSLVSSPSVRDVGKRVDTEEPQQQQGEDDSSTESEPDFHSDEMLRALYLNLKEKRKHDKEMAAEAERRRKGAGQSSGSGVDPDDTNPDFDPTPELPPVAPTSGKRKKRPTVKKGKKMSKQLQKMTAKLKKQRLNIIVGSSSVQTTSKTTSSTTSPTTTTKVLSTTTPVPSIMSMPTLHAPMLRVGATVATSVTTTFGSTSTSAFQPFLSSPSADQTFQDLMARFNMPQDQQTVGSSSGVSSSSSSESQFAALHAQINNILGIVQVQSAENLANRRMIEAMAEREKTYLLMLKSAKDETDSLKSEVNHLRIANTQHETRLPVYESENKKLREQVEKLMGDLPRIRRVEEGEESEEDNDEC